MHGDIAQLGERGVRNAEVGGSIPPISTKASNDLTAPRQGTVLYLCLEIGLPLLSATTRAPQVKIRWPYRITSVNIREEYASIRRSNNGGAKMANTAKIEIVYCRP